MKLNKLADPCFDFAELERKYSFYRFECDSYRQRVDLCDHLKTFAPVMSVRNSGFSEDYHVDVMAVSDPMIDEEIRKIGTSEDSSKENVTVTSKSPRDLPNNVLLQLMMAALSKDEIGGGPSNISGNFYLIVDKKYNKKKSMTEEIVALEFRIIERDYSGQGLKDCYLVMNVRTFTNYKLKNYIEFRKNKPAESYPRYVIDGPCIRRMAEGDTGDTFILRCMKYRKKRSDVGFFSYENKEKMEKNKIRLLSEIQEQFNLKYHGLAKLDFSDEQASMSIRPNSTQMSRNYEQRIDRILKTKPVLVINTLGDEGKDISEAIVGRFEERGYDVREDPHQGFDTYIVKIIHNKDYYLVNGLSDLHSPATYSSLQHVTLEDFKKSKASIDAVATNLAIKADIIAGRMSITDWTLGKLSFAMKIDDREGLDSEYAILSIDVDGKLSFEKRTAYDSSDFRLGTAMMTKGVVGAIVRGSDVNVIRETDIFTIPDIKRIYSRIKQNEKEGIGRTTGLKTRYGQDYLEEMIDINSIPINDSRLLYFVGKPGSADTRDLSKAVRVRMVEAWEGSELFFRDIMELMDVYFVRHEQLTVIPYPFKYLREWCCMNGLLDEEEEPESMIDDDQDEGGMKSGEFHSR